MTLHDLTPRLARYLDSHLTFPLLEFLSDLEIFRPEDLLAAKYALLCKTDMIDFAVDVYGQLHQGQVPPKQDLRERDQVMQELAQRRTDTESIISLLKNPDIVAQMRQDKKQNMAYLTQQHQFEPEMLNKLMAYAKLSYQCGNYDGAVELLYHVRLLSLDPLQTLSAAWGKLACEILTQNWDAALEEVMYLKESIDNMSFKTHGQQLMQRVTLLHQALFVFFNHPRGRHVLLDVMLSPPYLMSIQNAAPYLLRYLATAVISLRRRATTNATKDLIKVIQLESNVYADPITQFVYALHVDLDFDGACRYLAECEKVLHNDFFLVSSRDEFLEGARRLLFETYCRIYKHIDLPFLSTRLLLTVSETEAWVQQLVRQGGRLDVKVDLDSMSLVSTEVTPQQQLQEKLRHLTLRLQTLNSFVPVEESS